MGNSAPTFGDSSSGVSVGNNLPWSDVSASDDGLASDFEMIDRDETLIMSGDVALAGEEMTFPSLEIAVNEEYVQPTIDAIVKGAKTGQIGDGKIFVIQLERCVRIRTGEDGQAAIG